MTSYEIDELIATAVMVAPFLICAIWIFVILWRDEKAVK